MEPLLRKICENMFHDSSIFPFEEHIETKDDGSGTTQRDIKLKERNKIIMSKNYHIRQLLNTKKDTYNTKYITLKNKIERLHIKNSNQAERIKVLEDTHIRYKNETSQYIRRLENQVKNLKRMNKMIKEERDKTPYACYKTIFDLYRMVQEGD